MAHQLKQQITLAEFEALIAQPENQSRTFEFIGGEIIEVPSNPFVSMIAARIITYIGMFLLKHDLGHVTGEAGGYMVNGERYAPDVAFISYAVQPELVQQGYNPHPPELAVEVISDMTNTEEQTVLRRKLVNYLAAGVLVWVVNPFDRFVEVYTPGQEWSVRVLRADDTLDGGAVLPGFTLTIGAIFPNKQD